MIERLSIYFVLALSMLIFNCSSQIGGLLINFDKDPASNSLVRLIVIDDDGNELQEVGFTVTDSNGRFNFGISDSVSASFLVEAVLSNGTIRGFAAGNGSATNLNPITDAFVRAIIYITETGNGTTLADFSRKEIRTILKGFEDNQDLWDLDFSQTTLLVNSVINLAGRDIPDAAGGEISGVTSASVATPDEETAGPVFALTDSGCSRNNYLLTGNFFFFDLLKDGELCKVYSGTGGEGTAYNVSYLLSISGDTFSDTTSPRFPGNGIDPPHTDPHTVIEDAREVVYGSVDTDAGLEVTRKVYVPQGGDYVRFLEIFHNPTGSDITLDSIEISGTLGIGDVGSGNVATLVETSGNLAIDENDAYAASVRSPKDKATPTVGYVWGGGLSWLDTADRVNMPPSNDVFLFYSWDDVTIPAGATKVFMHFAIVSTSSSVSEVKDLLEALYFNPDETGLSVAELTSLQNFQVTNGNISGEAGSVASYTDLTITNTASSAAVTIKAQRDGSFKANLGATAGQELTVVGSDSTSATISIP